MKLIRKIDWYLQIAVLALSVIFIPAYYFFAPLIGLFILGILQLVSALLNTHSFIHSGYRKQIFIYWLFTMLDLLLLIIGWQFSLTTPGSEVLITISVTGGFILSIYYIVMYKKLIDTTFIRDELSGFIKS